MTKRVYLSLLLLVSIVLLSSCSVAPTPNTVQCTNVDLSTVLSDQEISKLDISNGDRQRYVDQTLRTGDTLSQFCLFRELAKKVESEYNSNWKTSHANSLYFLQSNLAFEARSNPNSTLVTWIGGDLGSLKSNDSLRGRYYQLAGDIHTPQSIFLLIDEYELAQKDNQTELQREIATLLLKEDFYTTLGTDVTTLTENLIDINNSISPQTSLLVKYMLLNIGQPAGVEFVYNNISPNVGNIKITSITNREITLNASQEQELMTLLQGFHKIRNPQAAKVIGSKIDFSNQDVKLLLILEGLTSISSNESLRYIITALEKTPHDASGIINQTLPVSFGRSWDIETILNESISSGNYQNPKNKEIIVELNKQFISDRQITVS